MKNIIIFFRVLMYLIFTSVTINLIIYGIQSLLDSSVAHNEVNEWVLIFMGAGSFIGFTMSTYLIGHEMGEKAKTNKTSAPYEDTDYAGPV